MNAENLRTLAHELRADPESYDQSTWGRKTRCGTVACIAGHAYAQARRRALKVTPPCRRAPLVKVAAAWLGLDAFDSEYLFMAGGGGWPPAFRNRLWRAQYGVEAPAFVAADLLDALADGTVSL